MEGVALALKGQEAMQREGHGLFCGKVLERLPALKSARLPGARVAGGAAVVGWGAGRAAVSCCLRL